ncbi:hypothetical protein FRX31_014359 [Thalictrum thalictroides]|uniref:Uncharacterized protein n=1 Tax=Thalictrum thalictroides TaxID=46969 RepID=A0A7J6WGF4_THATH|nr:hypothetical protein FRX31_014359 [Thalictrum thalictroides]
MVGDEVNKGLEENVKVCSVVGQGVGESIGQCGRCEERDTAVGECIVVGAEADKGREGETMPLAKTVYWLGFTARR